MIFGLGWTNWLRLGVWLVIGLVFYFGYGRAHSRLETGNVEAQRGTLTRRRRERCDKGDRWFRAQGPGFAVALLLLIIAGGTLGYIVIEGWGAWDAFYMTSSR